MPRCLIGQHLPRNNTNVLRHFVPGSVNFRSTWGKAMHAVAREDEQPTELFSGGAVMHGETGHPRLSGGMEGAS